MPTPPSSDQYRLPLLPGESSDPIPPPVKEPSRIRKRRGPLLEGFAPPIESKIIVELGESAKERQDAPAPKSDLGGEQAPAIEVRDAEKLSIADAPLEDLEGTKKRSFLQRAWKQMLVLLTAVGAVLWVSMKVIEDMKTGVDLWVIFQDLRHMSRPASVRQDNKQDTGTSVKAGWKAVICDHESEKIKPEGDRVLNSKENCPAQP